MSFLKQIFGFAPNYWKLARPSRVEKLYQEQKIRTFFFTDCTYISNQQVMHIGSIHGRHKRCSFIHGETWKILEKTLCIPNSRPSRQIKLSDVRCFRWNVNKSTNNGAPLCLQVVNTWKLENVF